MSGPATSQRQPGSNGGPAEAGAAAGLSGTRAAGQAGPAPEFTRLRLDLAYDGSGFHGWAAQPGLRSVQDVTQDALGRVLALAAAPALTVAGRTDAGVHARGQVAHVDVPEAAWFPVAQTALRRLNLLLPADVRLRSVAAAPSGFDARFCALWRRYSYRVCDDPVAADPLRRGDTLWHPRRLDTGRMNHAARACLGEHDFAAFCRRRAGATTIRQLLGLEWARTGPGVVLATIVADAFCHNMVRSMAGALLAVGDGSRELDWLAELLAARIRDPAVRVAPPYPLCLEEVCYPPDAELSARARLTRSVRHSPA